MPLFSVLFFILCLSNMGTPLTLNFVGEFLSLYGAFERLPLLGALSASSIFLSAAFTIYLFNRISFSGSLSAYFKVNVPDLTKREFSILMFLVVPITLFGIYPAVILDGLHYSVSTLIYGTHFYNISMDGGYSTPGIISSYFVIPFARLFFLRHKIAPRKICGEGGLEKSWYPI